MCILIPQVCTTGEVWYKKKEKKVGDIKKKKIWANYLYHTAYPHIKDYNGNIATMSI